MGDPEILCLLLFVNIHRIWLLNLLSGKFKYQPPLWPTETPVWGEGASEWLVMTNSVTAIALQGALATPRHWRCLGPPEAEAKLGWPCGPQGLGLRGPSPPGLGSGHTVTWPRVSSPAAPARVTQ